MFLSQKLVFADFCKCSVCVNGDTEENLSVLPVGYRIAVNLLKILIGCSDVKIDVHKS